MTTQAEMQARREAVYAFCAAQQPVTSRGVYYNLTVSGHVPKTEPGYSAAARTVLDMRRAGTLPYPWIADLSRSVMRPYTLRGVPEALEDAARTYRLDMWQDAETVPHVFLEKRALAGVLRPVTNPRDVPLCPTGGQISETFAYSIVEAMEGTGQALHAITLFDCDRAGADAHKALAEKLARFGRSMGVTVTVEALGLHPWQVTEWGLPTRPPKRNTTADARWPWPFAAELDAIPPNDLRKMVQAAIERFQPPEVFHFLREREAAQRDELQRLIRGLSA
ncbi:hypothetical protein MR829_11325 [Paracoccus versutus]|uniref:hypothetical protein n=1 Tax=Paracoccus versutus TaxID=34007 RepID=UPI001FB6BA7B|nr:hypothetical protein [Paracoccus versutus]MCJ1900964.1 hypothetical protein [Paracoccus versutus]